MVFAAHQGGGPTAARIPQVDPGDDRRAGPRFASGLEPYHVDQ